MDDEPETSVRATQRSLDIIEALRDLNGAPLTRISAYVDLPHSTVHNHLSTLVDRGVVIREGDTYRLSLRLLDLGEHTRRRRKVYNVAGPELSDLAEKTGEVVSLVVEENGRGVYLAIARGEHAVPLDTQPGTHVPLHASAQGKSILAHLSDDRVNEIIERHVLSAETENTITDRDALIAELADIRETGIAYDDAEQFEGVRSVAHAIKDESGTVIGTLGVSGPRNRLVEERFTVEVPSLLRQSTNVIELTLAHSRFQ